MLDPVLERRYVRKGGWRLQQGSRSGCGGGCTGGRHVGSSAVQAQRAALS